MNPRKRLIAALLARVVCLSGALLAGCAPPPPDPGPARDLPSMGPSWSPGRLPLLRRHLPPSSERPPWYTDPPANPERIRLPDDGHWMSLAEAAAAVGGPRRLRRA